MKNSYPKNSPSRKSRIFNLRVLFVALAAVALLAVSTRTAFMAPGSIWTTNMACGGVNINLYASKDDVYLNGGPQGGGSGLADGAYYVQVTEPNGTVLGTSVGSAIPQPFVVLGGMPGSCYQLSAIVIKASDQTPGYDDTTNSGGEYKVWVSSSPTFTNSESKTDNFKVKENSVPPSGLLKINKFYDADVSGGLTPGDTPIIGWEVRYGAQADFNTSNEPGFTQVSTLVEPGCYTAQEGDATNWIHTNPSVQSVAVPDSGEGVISFGNVCLGPGGGMTLGFWSNKNGQSLVDAADLTALGVLNLRNANGSHFPGPNPAAPTYSAYRTWLLSANATNMAYMLSAQLSAMKLNVLNGKVSGSAIVYAPGTGINGNDFVTINALMTAADTELGLHENTTSGGLQAAFRALQEALKNALDKANNNLNFVQSAAACGVAQDGTLTGVVFSFPSGDVTAPPCP